MSTGTPKKSAARYLLLGVHPRGLVVEGHTRGAPSDALLCDWGKSRGCSFVVRYFPTKKGWTALDIRNARQSTPIPPNNYVIWRGQVRLPRIYPSEDAAVMHAMAILNIQPSLL